jgi:hypothetical protein
LLASSAHHGTLTARSLRKWDPPTTTLLLSPESALPPAWRFPLSGDASRFSALVKVRQRRGIGSSMVLAMLGRAPCAWLCAFSGVCYSQATDRLLTPLSPALRGSRRGEGRPRSNAMPAMLAQGGDRRHKPVAGAPRLRAADYTRSRRHVALLRRFGELVLGSAATNGGRDGGQPVHVLTT